MRIAFVSGTFFPQPGGAQVQTHNICNKLKEKNCEIDCYIFNKTDIKNNNYNILLINKFLISFVYFFRYYLNINLNFIIKIYLKKIIISKKYKVWHFIFLNSKCLILIDCLTQLNQKVIVTFQGADIQIDKSINYGFRLNKFYELYLKKIIGKIDHFFYISQTIKQDLLNLSVPEEKMSYNPNSVEIEKFQKFEKKNKLNKTINLITVARYSSKKKGFDILLDLSKILIEKNIDFKWTIVGKNTKKLLDFEIIKQNIKFFNIIENIENTDETYFPHSQLIKYYIVSDIYVNCSRIESFGITFIEALAANLPVVTFNSKGANEIVKNNFNGYIVNNNSELIDKIIDLYKNPNQISDIKNNLLDSIKKYDLNLATNKILDTNRFL